MGKKKKKFEGAKRFIAPTVPRRPQTLPPHEIARRTASIRQINVAKHMAHAERLVLAGGIKKTPTHQTTMTERDALLGATMHGSLPQKSHNRLKELSRLLDAI